MERIIALSAFVLIILAVTMCVRDSNINWNKLNRDTWIYNLEKRIEKLEKGE